MSDKIAIFAGQKIEEYEKIIFNHNDFFIHDVIHQWITCTDH
jgi:hypothetical protein